MPGQRLCLCHLRRALRSGGGYTAGGRGYSTLPHARHAGGLDFRGVSARLTGDTLRRGDPRQGASGLTLFSICPSASAVTRSEEHTSELQSLRHLVCRLLLDKKNSIGGRFPPPPHLGEHGNLGGGVRVR